MPPPCLSSFLSPSLPSLQATSWRSNAQNLARASVRHPRPVRESSCPTWSFLPVAWFLSDWCFHFSDSGPEVLTAVPERLGYCHGPAQAQGQILCAFFAVALGAAVKHSEAASLLFLTADENKASLSSSLAFVDQRQSSGPLSVIG